MEIYIIAILICGGGAIGWALTSSYYKKKVAEITDRHLNALKRENDLYQELSDLRLENDILRGQHTEVSDKLLEELCGALEGDTVELPSFGTIDTKNPGGLKTAFLHAVEADRYLLKENII